MLGTSAGANSVQARSAALRRFDKMNGAWIFWGSIGAAYAATIVVGVKVVLDRWRKSNPESLPIVTWEKGDA